jgi:hypothetical protein
MDRKENHVLHINIYAIKIKNLDRMLSVNCNVSWVLKRHIGYFQFQNNSSPGRIVILTSHIIAFYVSWSIMLSLGSSL